ncbi:MAG: PIN domain-containing protein [Microgenomates group bacterium]
MRRYKKIVPILIILEVANILKKSPEEILTIFSGGEIIELDLGLVKKLIPILKWLNLKTSDALIAGCAKIYQAELISWDKKLVKEAKKIVKAFTPQNYF